MSKQKENAMKAVTMVRTMAGPKGIARPGTVLQVQDAEAQALIDDGAARLFDEKRDARAQRGLAKPPEKFE